MKPLFTVHAGEFLVACEIEQKFPHLNVWIPTKDSGIDLLVSNKGNNNTVSLQVKFSRDYLLKNIRGGGWWTLTRQQIAKSNANYWVFVLVGSANRPPDFIIISPGDLLKRLNAIHRSSVTKFQSYLWVTEAKKPKCYETRGLNKLQKELVAKGKFDDAHRNFTAYLNNWKPLQSLNR